MEWTNINVLDAVPIEHKKDHRRKKQAERHTAPACMHVYSFLWIHSYLQMFKKNVGRGWKDGSAVGSTCGSCRGSGLSSQCPQDGSQPSVAPVPRDQMPCDFCKHLVQAVHVRAHSQDTHTNNMLI